MSKGREENRIYIDSTFSGLNIGYIEVNEAQAKFIKKEQITVKNPKFISFHTANGRYFTYNISDSNNSQLFEVNSTSPDAGFYHRGRMEDCYDSYPAYFDRLGLSSLVKTPVVINGEYSYFALVDAYLEDYDERILYLISIYLYESDNSHRLADYFFIEAQRRNNNSGLFVFELGRNIGKFIVFSMFMEDSSYPDIGYLTISCSGSSCYKETQSEMFTSCDYSSSYIVSVKKDTSHPNIFYIACYCDGSFLYQMFGITDSGYINYQNSSIRDKYNNYDVSFGFTAQLGEQTYSSSYTSATFLVGYFDKTYKRFRVGLTKTSSTYNSRFYVNISSSLGITSNSLYVVYNGGNNYIHPNSFFYTSSSSQSCVYGTNYCGSATSGCSSNGLDCLNYVNLTENRSLRVSAGQSFKNLTNEAKCNDEEDYLLIGDYYYYCVSSCGNYFNSLTLKTSGLTHTCENKIAYTDYGKTNSRCLAGFVKYANSCPDLSIAAKDNYKFRYIHSTHVEYRYDCRDEHILKPTGEAITTTVDETGTCGTCDYRYKRLVLSSTYFYYDNSNAQTAVKRKYCFDKCDIAPFTIRYEITLEGVTSYYCTDTCAKALSTTEVPIETLFHLPIDNDEDYCAAHCPSDKIHITCSVNNIDIAGALTKPVCNASCPDSTNYRIYNANFTDAFEITVNYNYCLSNCNTEEKKFTQAIGDWKHCVNACPSNEPFYYNHTPADNQLCVSVCPSSHPYIVGHHTHTGDPSEIIAGKCDTACENSDHYKYEMTTGVYLCLEQCYPNPNLVENNCTDGTCDPYRSFFKSDRICVKECPNGTKHLKTFSGVIDPITNESTRGLCDSDCLDNTYFRYMNPTTTCINCPGSCTEASIDAMTDNIYAGSADLNSLNNGCTRVHCLQSNCHSDKPFFTPQKICHSECPKLYKHLRFYTGIIDTIAFDSAKGLCDDDCPSNYFRYMSPTNTCEDCPSSCTETSIDAMTDNIYSGNADLNSLNNGCTRVHCLVNNCHSDKPFFTPQKICHSDCPKLYKHLRFYTGIINTIYFNSAKGLCDNACPSNYFRYMSSTNTCTNCPSSCTEASIEALTESFYAGNEDLADFNNGCTRVHCLESNCHSDKPFFTPKKICHSECPKKYKHLRFYTGIIDAIAFDSAKGLCDDTCPNDTYFRYMSPTNTCKDCPSSCTEASIDALTDNFYASNEDLADLNNSCARVHCLQSNCHSDKPFFTPKKICHSDCPKLYKHLRFYTGIIDTIAFDSAKGLCDNTCPSNYFRYMSPTNTCVNCPSSCTETSIDAMTDAIYTGDATFDSLNNGCTRVHCLPTNCHSDKPFFTPQKICHSDCPKLYKHLRFYTGIINTIAFDSAKGLCDNACPSNYFRYMSSTNTCTNCPSSCTETSIDAMTDNIYAGNADLNSLNNGCTRVHCLVNNCHSDKPFFTPQKICHSDCPKLYKHLRFYTGIIDTIAFDSAKGLCDDDCPNNHFKFISATANCSESAINSRLSNILAETVDVSDLNNLCARVHCLPSRCHSAKPFFTDELICFFDCPILRKHLQTFSGILDTVEYDSTEGLCKEDCPEDHFKYINPTTTCFNCPLSCSESQIASELALVETGAKPVSYMNNLCARVHCLASECQSDKPFFTPNLICYTLCPPSHQYVRKFTGIIDKMEFNSTKGQCNIECNQTEYIYFNVSTQNQNHCLDECHEDKPYWDVNRLCLAICPTHISLVNPPDPNLPYSVSLRKGICKATCEGGFNFRYNFPDNTHQYYCLKQCEIPKKYFVRYASFNECVYECPFHLRYVHPETQECLSECPSSHPYYDTQGICMEKCDEFIFEWECKASCNPGYNYLIQQGCAALCSKDIVGWDCKPYCPPNYPSKVNNYCAVSCLKNQFLDEVTNFSLPNEFGICKGGCDGYLIEGGVFSSGISKVYCVPSCPELYMKEIRSSTEKWCRKECVKDSIWKFTVLGDSCVSDCIYLGYKFISEDYECLDECSFFIDKEIWCVSKCPIERPFVFNQRCIEECPGNARFVDKFTFCVPKCDSFNYNIFCVDSCDSEELGAYYLERQLDFKPLRFVHSTLNCAEACNEPGFEWINETNNQCVASCPLPCRNGVCPQPEMKYKEPSKYCRKACNTPEFPFVDVLDLECLPECKPQRRFFVEENRICLSKCPKEKPLIFEKAVCEDRGVCDKGCGKIHSTCVDSCPKQAAFTLEKDESIYCLCICPQFYRPKPGTIECELFCDDKLGLLPNKNMDGCDACNSERLFLWEGECIRECPQGTLSNTFSSCRTCKQLGLWRDHTFSCLKFHECSELSLFDYNNQICTRCDGDGMMVRKVFPGDFVCLKTECNDGHIILEKIKKCYVCPSGWFFFNETCFKSCPEGFFNDYIRWICTENCFESCSEDCCVNGTCKIAQQYSECTCNPGFFGKKCEIGGENLNSIIQNVQNYLINKLKDKIFTKADVNALLEFYFYAKESLKPKRNLNTINPLLAYNLKLYIEEIRIPFAFQPEVMRLIDSYLLIEHLSLIQSEDPVPFSTAISFLDSVTDDIQLFLTQNNEVQDFERVFQGKVRGQAFSFQFGTDITEVTEVNVTKCISRIIERDSLPYGTRFPFKLLRFSSEIDSSVSRELLHAFNLSSNGRFELTFYMNTGLYPLNEVCRENYVDTTEEVQLEPEKKQSTQKFINIGVNVFDITVPFFNDKCVPYQSEDGKDLTLRERKAKLFKDPSELCSETAAKVCSVDGFTEEGEAICVCRGIQDKKKSSLQSFASTYPQTNYILVTCYTTFREADVFRNVGFYIVFLSFLSFTLSGLRSMFHSDSEIESPKRFRFVRNDVVFFDPDAMKIETYFENCYSLKNDLELLMIQVQIKENTLRNLSIEEKDHLFAVLPTICDLKYLTFDQLLEFDRRSHFQFAIDIFTEKNTLFSTFYMDSLVFPKYFRIMFFVTEFNLNITLNAFFIDDDLVENFNQQEETGLFYSMTNEATKTFWAFLTTKLVMAVFKGLYYVSSKNVAHLLRRMKVINSDYMKRAFNLFLFHTRVASLLFSFIAIVFNLLCAYFVIVFCEIYKNSIDIWINGIYMGWIFEYLVLGGIVPVLLIGSRYLSTKNNKLSFLYKLSNLIDIMLSLGLN